MPDVNALYLNHAGDDILVYALHPGDPPDLVADFIEQTGISIPVIDSRGTLNRFRYPPGVGYPYPRDVVIGKDRTVRSIRNSFNITEMEELVTELLAE